MVEQSALRPIKRLLKHRTTHQYYAGAGKWTSTIDQAKDFESIWRVTEEVSQYALKGCCVVVLRFDSQEFDVELSV